MNSQLFNCFYENHNYCLFHGDGALSKESDYDDDYGYERARDYGCGVSDCDRDYRVFSLKLM